MRTLVALLWLAVPLTVLAQDQSALATLRASKVIVCSFNVLTYGYWTKGQPGTDKATQQTNVFIGSIDWEVSRTATVISPHPVFGQARILITAAGPSFIGQTEDGDVWITTVFTSPTIDKKTFYAVHSVHASGFAGDPPQPRQYHGTCQIK